jgi:alkylation response protein AidB-like acyl-CoA dehydrogenase
MEFGFTEEQEKLRKEIHDFLANELPEDHKPGVIRRGVELENFATELQKKGTEKGYPTAGWPRKYGGLGYTWIEQAIQSEELGYWGASWQASGPVAFSLVGPTILTVGTDEQKEKWVPPIARGEVVVAEAFTEPDAGSDEANVQLRAVPDGDDYVLNGQKTFISTDRKPDWLYTLTKTADVTPPHRGLSLFMVPGDTPGLSYRPLPTLGGSAQNEIFYDDVRVPKENLLGELNRGFYHAMTTFEFERASVPLDARRSMERWVQFCREEKRHGEPLIRDPQVRETLAEMAVQQEIDWLTGWYSAWRSSQREKLGPQPYNLSALYRKEKMFDSAKALMDMCGLYGQLKPESKYAKFDGSVQRRWQGSPVTHPAGTIEINKYVVAGRGLGLPRVPRKFNKMINDALVQEGR